MRFPFVHIVRHDVVPRPKRRRKRGASFTIAEQINLARLCRMPVE
jgi:hypothetical protein